VPLKLPNGHTLHVFGVHFPSQANPSLIRAKALEQLIAILRTLPKEDLWIVGGDFNITGLEDDREGFVSKKLAGEGLVSHLVGCRKCKGTHNYRGVWDFLDILVFSPHFSPSRGPNSPVRLIKDSIWTPNSAANQLDRSGRPWRFDELNKAGVSDHLPIYAEFELQ
jgi:endonuclease/exonuclease/phosphatase family metal-dependent hydrolase